MKPNKKVKLVLHKENVPQQSMVYLAAAELLARRDNFLIITHKRPDGDTIGSAAALCRFLRGLGKTAFIYNNREITPKYYPLVAGLVALSHEYVPDTIITVDTASLAMLPTGATAYREDIDIVIDHHESNTRYGKYCLVENRAACGEVIYELIAAFSNEGFLLPADIAEAIYVAVSTDTGCFSYSNTTAESLFVAARCAVSGISLERINKILFRTTSRARAIVESDMMHGIKFYENGRAAVAIISSSIQESTGVSADDLENIASVASSIEGVDIAYTITEIADGECKVSVRTNGAVSANNAAKLFGGGGHRGAAGFVRKGSGKQVRRDIENRLNLVFESEIKTADTQL
ncbi:MAG: DHH family phosphoesterase [Oscillospiraceae bacterium]|jgi:phosphoesterase RecJ-like protein|nr:DHH family phosphoesterase [Oscillospiraceae bacterium]